MSSLPRYRELAEEMREAILSERTLLDRPLTNGSQLPTEPDLCDHFQVSRGTIRQALRELAAEGLLETRGRSGTYVRRLRVFRFRMEAETPNRKKSPTDTWFSEVKNEEREPSQDFGFRIEAATATVAGRLEMQVKELVVVRDISRYIDGTLWSSQISYYPYEIAKQAGLDSPEDIPEGTIRRLAERGFVQDSLEHEITSRPANDDERAMFQLSPGVPVLLYRRVARAGTQTLRYTQDVLPADRNIITQFATEQAQA